MPNKERGMKYYGYYCKTKLDILDNTVKPKSQKPNWTVSINDYEGGIIVWREVAYRKERPLASLARRRRR